MVQFGKTNVEIQEVLKSMRYGEKVLHRNMSSAVF